MSSTGRFSAAAIQKTMRPNAPVVRACYEAGLQRNPNLVGRVSVRFTIDVDGRVTSAENAEQPGAGLPAARAAMKGGPVVIVRVKRADPLATGQSVGPMPDAKVVSCVLAAFKKLRFPKSAGGKVTVVYPFIFSPNQ